MVFAHFRLTIRTALIVIAATFWASATSAQESYEASNLTLKKTYFKAAFDDLLNVDDTATPVFSPTLISCPARGTCSVRVHVSAQLLGVPPGIGVNAAVWLDGILMRPYTIGWHRNAGTAFTAANSFAWIETDILPGDHTVEVTFQASSLQATIDSRTLSIDVLKQ